MKSGGPIRTIFMGTPDFAVPTLRALNQLLITSYQLPITTVITQPDKPVGRKRTLTPPPVKVAAIELKLPVFQPEKLRDPDTLTHITELAPDLIVVAAYGKIIPKAILDIPTYGTINVHASLLPRHRGASPIQAAIRAGDTETGVAIMFVDEELDHGPILAEARIPIATDETGGSLVKKLAALGAELLTATLPEWIQGKIEPREQDHALATFTKPLTREDGKIDWSESAEIIERKVRAYDPWPGTWTLWDKTRLHIIRATPTKSGESRTGEQPGTVIKTDYGFAVQCGAGALEILELQPEGKRIMSANEFLRGHSDIIGARLS